MSKEQILEALGKYRILGELGRGGFAIVFRALDTTLDREVALKVLHPHLLGDATTVSRFRREASAAARLQHPHIITIHEVGEAERRLYIAMALAEGGSLLDLLAARGALSWSDALSLARAIASALDYAHARQVVHRDLKPANILLRAGGTPWVTDFGFARLLGDTSLELSVSGAVLGTLSYIAPELWDRQPATAASDVYALGCIIVEMLTGVRAFDGDTPLAAVAAHQQGFAPPPVWPDGVPGGDEVTIVLKRALDRSPDRRYAGAGELVAALDEIDARRTGEEAQQAALGALLAQARAGCEVGDWLAAQSACVQVMMIDRAHPEALAMMAQATQALQRESAAAIARRQRMARYEAGLAALEAQRWADAVAALSGVASEDADFEDVQAKLAQARAWLQVQTWETEARQAMGKERWEEACRRWVKVVRAHEETREPWVKLLESVDRLVEIPQPGTTRPKAAADRAPAEGGSSEADPRRLSETKAAGRERGPREPAAGKVQVWPKDGKEMVYVPAGEFLYGDEKAKLRLPGYWIDRSPVTNVEYALFVAATGQKAPAHWKGATHPPDLADHPVVNVSWHDAVAYCEWVGKRLPAEEEWEKAARGTDGRVYPWGDPPPTSELCNFNKPGGGTTPVGECSPGGDSPYGCVDMAGNVWEWTNSLYDGKRDHRVLRGGSWNGNEWYARSAYRYRNAPTGTNLNYGFRCASPQSS